VFWDAPLCALANFHIQYIWPIYPWLYVGTVSFAMGPKVAAMGDSRATSLQLTEPAAIDRGIVPTGQYGPITYPKVVFYYNATPGSFNSFQEMLARPAAAPCTTYALILL